MAVVRSCSSSVIHTRRDTRRRLLIGLDVLGVDGKDEPAASSRAAQAEAWTALPKSRLVDVTRAMTNHNSLNQSAY